jgi:hypothetical protein
LNVCTVFTGVVCVGTVADRVSRCSGVFITFCGVELFNFLRPPWHSPALGTQYFVSCMDIVMIHECEAGCALRGCLVTCPLWIDHSVSCIGFVLFLPTISSWFQWWSVSFGARDPMWGARVRHCFLGRTERPYSPKPGRDGANLKLKFKIV